MNKIKEYRKKIGLTQKELADITGISLMSIRRYEGGERIPDVYVMRKIADALNVNTLDELILSDTKNLDGKKIYDACKKLEIKPSELGLKLDYNSGFFQPGDDIDEIMEQSFGPNSSYDSTKEEADAYTAIEDRLLNSFVRLNTAGKEKAVEQVELLTRVPEYQHTPDQEEK